MQTLNKKKLLDLLKKEEYIYKICRIRMSNRAMADILYAAIITKSAIVQTHGIGIYNYSRSQNGHNNVDLNIHIHPSVIEIFEGVAKVKLHNHPTVHVN